MRLWHVICSLLSLHLGQHKTSHSLGTFQFSRSLAAGLSCGSQRPFQAHGGVQVAWHQLWLIRSITRVGGWGAGVVCSRGSGCLRLACRSYTLLFLDPHASPQGLRRGPCPPLTPGLDFSRVERLALRNRAGPPLFSAVETSLKSAPWCSLA